MDTLLAAMKGVTAPMLLQVIGEMEQHYTGEHLSRHLRRFRTILRRSKTLSAQDKQIVENRMRSYDSLLESDPDIQRIKAESKIEAKQDSAILVVEAGFPNLVETAKQKVARLNKIDEINTLTKMIARAPDEKTAQWVLDTFAA